MILQKLINPLKDMRIILFFVIFYIFFTASSKISLIPTGDEIHRIIQSHSLAYDLDIDMKNTYESKKFFKWACCDRHILPQSYESDFNFIYDTSKDDDNGDWISKSQFNEFPKIVKISVENFNTITIFDYSNEDESTIYMKFEPDSSGNNIIRKKN